MQVKLSFVIIVKNEQANIREVLDSVKGWVDEIIVVDDESTDDTCQIASEYTDKIYKRKMGLEGKQRNWAVSVAKNDWILTLDADERMTAALKKEIEEVLSNHDGKTMAYWIPQQSYIGDYCLRYGGWDGPHIKLYNKNFLRWKEIYQDVVHPGVEIAPGYQGAKLKNPFIHYTFKNIEDFINKVNRQSTLEAIKWHRQGKKISLFIGLWRGYERFWKRYFYKRGRKDGFIGFAAAFLSGFYQFAAYCKFREIKSRGIYLDRIKDS